MIVCFLSDLLLSFVWKSPILLCFNILFFFALSFTELYIIIIPNWFFSNFDGMNKHMSETMIIKKY